MKDVSRREFLKTLCLGITVAALQNLPMTTAFADSAISKTKTIFYKGIMPNEKVLDLPVDCNTLTGSVNL